MRGIFSSIVYDGSFIRGWRMELNYGNDWTSRVSEATTLSVHNA